ncbi:patatin-like phospholipase family protein, partial [candidate division KSB1 bacterium]|nr:patatin-like phospholipase family protein [candidate division KSB1 bacterium]
MKKQPKIALALGGGGARGCAHIGALKALERENIPIDMIVGTSIGAVVGAIYADNPVAFHLEERFKKFLKSEEYKKSGLELFKRKEPAENFFGQVATNIRERLVVNLAQSKTSLVRRNRLQGSMDFLIPEGRIENTKIPFYTVASNLLNGEQVVFNEGDMRTIVGASASFPGFLPPYQFNGDLLVDGSVLFTENARDMRVGSGGGPWNMSLNGADNTAGNPDIYFDDFYGYTAGSGESRSDFLGDAEVFMLQNNAGATAVPDAGMRGNTKTNLDNGQWNDTAE